MVFHEYQHRVHAEWQGLLHYQHCQMTRDKGSRIEPSPCKAGIMVRLLGLSAGFFVVMCCIQRIILLSVQTLLYDQNRYFLGNVFFY